MLIPDYTTGEEIYGDRRGRLLRGTEERSGSSVLLRVLEGSPPPLLEAARIRQGYELARRLDLDHVVEHRALFEDPALGPVVILEDSGDELLANRIAALTALSLQETLRLAVALTETLGRLHHHRLIHKDLHPAALTWNAETGRCRLLGLNIATQLSNENQSLVYPGTLEGRLEYVSPEQTGRMNRQIDYRSDFYSLGAVLYEALAGRPPFETQDPMRLIHAHIAVAPRSLHEINPAIPATLDQIILKLLNKNAEDRYQSAFGLKYDLEECLRSLNSYGQIRPFPVGEKNVSEKFEIPQRLYGREAQIRELVDSFDRVAFSGRVELLLVSGYSGIGKSVLVREVHKPIVERRGYFISGKIDQYRRDIPYSALIQAFQELARQILTEDEERVNEWRGRLHASLGANGRVLTDVVPRMELILGTQPEVPALPAAEEQNRFNQVFGDFVRTFARHDHPLVLFLDDLQWCDTATFNLIKMLMEDPDTHHLLIIGAYRDNEVGVDHPLMTMSRRLQEGPRRINDIHLAPLETSQVRSMVADTLQKDPDQVYEIADLIGEKTQSNPFFIVQFLTSLRQEDLLRFDADGGAWHWDLEKIKAADLPEGVVAFMTYRIQRLSPSVRESLRVIACMGNRFDLQTFAVVFKKNYEQAARDLQTLLQTGLLVPLDENYKYLGGLPTEARAFEEFNVQYRFLHDRIQQAAYSLNSDAEKSKLHLSIGRVLLNVCPPADMADRIFEIVNQFNAGSEHINDPAEKKKLASLNLLAGRRARASAAYDTARSMLRRGIDCLAVDAWEKSYDLNFELHLLNAECEYLAGNFDESERLFTFILDHARSKLDEARVARLRIVQYVNQDKVEQAVFAALKGLRALGVKIPPRPSRLGLLSQTLRVYWQRGRRETHELEDLPRINNPEIEMALELMNDIVDGSYAYHPVLFAYLTTLGVNLSLKHGASRVSGLYFIYFGSFQGSLFGRYKQGQAFADAGLKLGQKFGDHFINGRMYFGSGCLVSHWRNHTSRGLEHLRKTIETAREVGDLNYLSYANVSYMDQLVSVGQPLDQSFREIEENYEQTLRTRSHWGISLAITYRQLVLNLMGKTRSALNWSDDNFDEEEFARTVGATGGSQMVWYPYTKMKTLYFYGEYAAALEWIDKSDATIGFSIGQIITSNHVFYKTLIYTALARQASSRGSRRHSIAIRKGLSQMKIWAHNSPKNFAHKYAILKAEHLNLKGKNESARRHYEEAIRLSRESGGLHMQALAHELAGRYYQATDDRQLFQQRMRAARDLYARWGAVRIVERLEQAHTFLEPSRDTGTTTTDTGGTTSQSETQIPTDSDFANIPELDMAALANSSRALSDDHLVDQLLSRLMRIMIENAGARRGCLILERDGELYIEAETSTLESSVAKSIRLSAHTSLPRTLIQYARRAGEHLISGDASNEDRFTADAYIREAKPFSILCLPVAQQGKLLGVLYLENDITRNAFREDRIPFLKMLASQAMVSQGYARLLAERIDQHRVREQIYTELHDNLGARLTDITILTDRLQALESPPEFREIHGALKKNAHTALEELRDRLQSRDDLALLEKDFGQGLHMIFLRRFVNAGRKIKFDLKPEVADRLQQTSAANRDLLFSVCKELATNDLKYGKDEATFEFSLQEKELELRMESRTNPDGAASGTGMGLQNIRQKMEAAGGSIQEQIQPDRFRYRIRWKL